MYLFLKMREIKEFDLKDQEEFITKYIFTYCELDKDGIKFLDFSIHDPNYSEKLDPDKKLYAVARCSIELNANFEKIESKIKLFNLHEYFNLFCVF